MKKILITGTSGFVGNRIYDYLTKTTNLNIIGVSRSEGKCVDMVYDLSNEKSIRNLRKEFDPDIVIHTAAMAKTDVCENDKKSCYKSNVTLTKNLVEIFPESKIIFFSTYAVYNSEYGHCDESCRVEPTNYYIETKIEAEKCIKTLQDYLILRPSVMFGYLPYDRKTQNYFMQLLQLIEQKKVLKSPKDQFFNPINISNVAEILKLSIGKNISGIFNIGSNEDISKYEFNRMIIEKFGFDAKYLEPINSRDLSVNRPDMGTISSLSIQRVLSYKIPSISNMIDALLDEVN